MYFFLVEHDTSTIKLGFRRRTNIILPFQEVVFESGSSVVRLLDESLVVAHQSLCVVCYPLCFSFDLVSLVLQVLTVDLKTREMMKL